MVGKVYIASMNMRGYWAKKPENTIPINVTSMQSILSTSRGVVHITGVFITVVMDLTSNTLML